MLEALKVWIRKTIGTVAVAELVLLRAVASVSAVLVA